MRTNDYTIRANEAFRKAISAWDKGNVAEYDRNKAILEEMVRDKCVSSEYIRDLEGSVTPIDPAFPDGGIF